MFVARTPEPRPRFCQPEEIVRSSLRDLKPEADARGVRLALEASSPPARVWADPDGLRHLADVLVRNALESTPKGGAVQVVTSVEPLAVNLTVRDNGRGITPAEGEHLFDPFYCGRQAGRGLGLGLPRAARIVQQAGGELRWHAAPGQGATFRVHIPLAPPPKPPALAGDPGTAQPSGTPTDPAPQRP
jgi:signal transduction histidine kinase